MVTLADPFNEQTYVSILTSIRWEEGLRCPYCGSTDVYSHGNYESSFCRYFCNCCHRTFNDKTGTIFEHSRIPLAKWFFAIYLLTKKQSTLELANELEIGYKAASRMIKLIHGSIYTNRIADKLRDTVEADEIYITSGSKGSTDLGRPPRKRGLKWRGRGSWDVDKPPVIGFVQRNGEFVWR